MRSDFTLQNRQRAEQPPIPSAAQSCEVCVCVYASVFFFFLVALAGAQKLRSALFVRSSVFFVCTPSQSRLGRDGGGGWQTNAFQSVTDFGFSPAVDKGRGRREKGELWCVWRGGLSDGNRGEKFPGHAGIMIMLDMCKCHFGSVQSGGVQRSECVFWF